jgi:glycosyltransferase involved in cell wall biosynthesis
MKKLAVLTLIAMNPNKLGALEEYALRLSRELKERGHFAVVGFLEFPPGWLEEKFRSLGIEVLKISRENGDLAFIKKVREAISNYDLNIVHATFYPFYSPLLIVATIGRGCKLIYSDQESRDSRPFRGFQGLFRFLRNRFYQTFIDAIIADAQFIKECQIRDHFTKANKVPVIYNGVNLKRFRRGDSAQRSEFLQKFKISPESFVIATIAQYIWQKGLNYLIDAAAIIVKERPNSMFFIIGDGPERSKLEQQAVSLNLRDNIIFTGQRVDTESFLSAADVFVLPSVWEEAFAFSLLEAMASSCPIVATRIGAIPESVEDGLTGILVPPRDAQAAADAILKLLNDNTLRLGMGGAARKRVEDLFSLDHWVDQTIKLYEKHFKVPAYDRNK